MPLGRDELVLQVGGEQAGRSDDARVRRHEHAGDVELERDVAREHRAAASRGDERELARVVAAAHRVQLDRLGHAVLLHLQSAERCILDGHAELGRDGLHRLLGERAVEFHAAAEQASVRAQASEQELRVRGCRLGAAVPVTGRARVGARRLRAHAEDAAGIDVRDRAAAGADRVDVDHRHHRLVVADLRVEEVAHPQLTARGNADVRRRAADVQRDHVVEAG